MRWPISWRIRTSRCDVGTLIINQKQAVAPGSG